MSLQYEQSQDKVRDDLEQQVRELTAANLVLKEQLERREQFIAMVAHELRGPLTPIISYAQMLNRPNQSPEATQRKINIIVSQGRRLDRLINDLLDSLRLTTGQFTLKCDTCDIAAFAQEVVEQLRPLAPYHQFAVETPDTPLVGFWDGDRLQQALGNLLDNAAKYSDEGTTITLSVSQMQENAHVSVNNQGASIPSADIGQLFHPYARLPINSTRRQGSGLGLYITKCIVEAHGGLLRLEQPTAEGQGTTFSFDLPLA